MKCFNCGKEIPDDSVKCPECEAEITQVSQAEESETTEKATVAQEVAMEINAKEADDKKEDSAKEKESKATSSQEPKAEEPPKNEPQAEKVRAEAPKTQAAQPSFVNCPTKRIYMTWHGVLVYFLLYACMALSVLTGIFYITGDIHFIASFGELIPDDFYYLAGQAYRVVDISFGSVCIILGIMALVARNRLAQRKKHAPGLVVALFYLYAFTGIAYNLAMEFYVQIPHSVNSIVLIWFAIECFFAYLNGVYFKKRKQFFEN